MSISRLAPVDWPINELIAGRWSPRAFSSRPVEREKLARLFEAARWAPSSFNEQPWRYVIATQDDPDAFERLASVLVEANQWARDAYLLVLSVAKLRLDRNAKPNRHAIHDVGASSENMFLQSVELGLCMHQMAGFDVTLAREKLGIPAEHEPVAMIAIGYPGDPAQLPEPLRERESAPRSRLPIGQLVFEGAWGAAPKPWR